MADSARSSGTVKWFSAQKGFGFISPNDGGEDLFVHRTSIQSNGFRTLSEDQAVEFLVVFAEDGRAKAFDVVAAIPRPHRPGFDRGRGRGSFGGKGGGRGGRGGYGRFGGGFDMARGGERGGRYGGYGGGYGGGRGSGGGECYNCGGIGHLARDCNQGGGGVRKFGGGVRGYGGRSGGAGGGGGCYNCGEEGHLARECPND